MKKVFFLSAIAALALSSCSSDETVQAPVQQDGAIAFDIYTGRAVSRGTDPLQEGDRQSITTKNLKASSEGFGVYAYETGAQKFKSYLANNTYPQYMFNQQVVYNEASTTFLTRWEYNPVKYWPNDDSHVTFQAYAPYKSSTENVLFDVKYNGVGIRYALDYKDLKNNYDLLWGENVETETCFENMTKPGIADKTMFHFQHALSKVDFTVSYNADNMDCNTPSGALDANTKIYIRSIKLLGTLPSQGVLSLYDGSWTVEKVSENKFEFDGDFFGCTNGIGYTDKTNLNPSATPITTVPAGQEGVLTTDVPKLYANSSVMLIPAETPVKLEISYDVVTTDPDGKNSHTKNITIVSDNIPEHWGNTHAGDTDMPYADAEGNVIHPESGAGQSGKPGVFSFDAGMHTTINIHLGMTSVKLDAEVKAWDKSESGSIDMPANAETPVVHSHQNIADAIAAGTLGVEGKFVKHIPFYTLTKKPSKDVAKIYNLDGFYRINGVWTVYENGEEDSCPIVHTFNNITDGKMLTYDGAPLGAGFWYIENIQEGPTLFHVTTTAP